MLLLHSILFNESRCNIDKYFYDRTKLQIFDPRDDLCKIRVQLLCAIGNLKGYRIHYISFALKDKLFCGSTRLRAMCNIDKYFYDHTKLQIIDPRDDLCKIRVQLLSAIGNLKGYRIHYIFLCLY